MNKAIPAQTVNDLIFNNIESITHIKTYRFLKALSMEAKLSSDGWVKLTYNNLEEKYHLNCFTVSKVVEECRKLNLIKTKRIPSDGRAGRTPQAYKLNLK